MWLVAHSNGPIMAIHFLNTQDPAFVATYIAGFIPLAGNFAGQGLLPIMYLHGLSVVDFSFFPVCTLIFWL